MYDKRLRIFIALAALLLFICLIRLAQMQLISQSYYRSRIEALQKVKAKQLSTTRGTILDNKGRKLAMDEPRFELRIHYELIRLMDEKFWQIKLVKQQEISKQKEKYKDEIEELQDTIYKCEQLFDMERGEIEEKIRNINERIWNLRTFLAWRENCPDSELLKNNNNSQGILLSHAIEDFEKKIPEAAQRLMLIDKINIAEMHTTWSILELQTDDDILAAQLQFMDSKWVRILPYTKRTYPYGPAGAQIIGWIGPAREPYKLPLDDDESSKYLRDDLAGRDGVEYVCEGILRGKRGKRTYNLDNQLVEQTKRQLGQDIHLTLDIQLQKRIQQYLADCSINANCTSPTAAVVLDILTGNILSMVSLPSFDLNTIRQDYSKLNSDPNSPLLNRAIRKQYPPGSVIKPVILIAGLETHAITPYEVISCPAAPAPPGWPNCWIFRKYSNIGHDNQWNNNNARNAIKGSCNIYFSRLANRLHSAVIQKWLTGFGYGRKILQGPQPADESGRDFASDTSIQMQFQGVISSPGEPTLPGELTPIKTGEKRLFGIGQGNLRATPLQVANAMAVIARRGIYKPPLLFIQDANDANQDSEVDLGIHPETLEIIRDGMHAVANEFGGTAYKEFQHSGFAAQDVTVYGKTGSTERPYHAWFAGFAEDSRGRNLAIAVVVEGGQHGSSDAGPLARDIIQFCIEAKYIGEE